MRFAAALALWVGAAAPALADHVTAAIYTEPTDRYDHGILGDAIEWGALQMEVQSCADCANPDRQRVTLRLPQSDVFEDVAPRLIDLDADGTQEVMVVETRIGQGARLVVYNGDGSVMAATPYIGRNHRWLAPIGAADMDGDGQVEVAYVDRPHLAKTLRIWRFVDGQLRPVTDIAGLSNHRIGEPDIGGGLRDCGSGVEMITANAGWTRVMATRFENGRWGTRELGPYVGRGSFAAALDCQP